MRRRTTLFRALLVALAVSGRARGGDDPPPAPPPSEAGATFSEVSGDPEGEATRRDREARALLERDVPDPAAAAERWMDLAELDPPALLPAPPEPATPGAARATDGLWWPAREVAFARLASLPPEGRLAVERRWGPRAQAALALALASGSRTALEALVREEPVTRAGSRALMLLADADLEAGVGARAARRLDAWIRWNPGETPARRAAAWARLLDARVLEADERGVVLVARRAADLGRVVVHRAGVSETLSERIAAALAAVSARLARAAAAEPSGPRPPTAPAVLWSRPIVDEGLVGEAVDDGVARAPVAAVAADGDALYVAQARVVRRLDLATGRVAWTFPEAPLAREHAPDVRYRPWERPVRAVVPAGGLVLAVVGDPPMPASGTYQFRSETVRALSAARESKARLVALGATTGLLAWVTGGSTESHPVLGAADVSVASAPLVERGRVYVVLSARRGSVESWLAVLDLATGRPLRVTALGRGESGLARTLDVDRTLVETRVRSVPSAERPTLSGDEVCVVTGAGYAVGVDAETGGLRWMRALPRYRYEDREGADGPPLERAHVARNAPVEAFGAWMLAAPDAPRLVGVETGTGRLRFAAEPRQRPDSEVLDGVPESPECQVLLGAGATADGHGVVRLAGEERALELRGAASGGWRSLPGFPSWVSTEGSSPGDGGPRPAPARGRPWSEGRRVVASRGGSLRTTTWPGASGRGDRTGRDEPWREDPSHPRPVGEEPLPPGDVVRAGDVWLVVGTERLVAVAEDEVARRVASAVSADPVDAAMRLALAARRDGSVASLSAAAAAVRRAGDDPSAADALSAAASACLLGPRGPLAGRRPEAAFDFLDAVDALPPSARAPLYLEVARALRAARRDEALDRLVARWRPWGDQALVDVDPAASGRLLQRSDLHAATALGPEAPPSAGARAVREADALADVEAAAKAGPDALAAAVARHAGTVAAWTGRVRLLGALLDAGRDAEAAGVAADARLPFEGFNPVVAPRPATAAALRALEATALERTGERDAARAALHEALATAPAAVRDVDGSAGVSLARRWAHEVGLVPASAEPERLLTLWPPGGPASDTALAEVRALEPTGPGAGPDLDHAIVARGLALEAWDLSTGARRPVHETDGGFLGVTMLDRTPGVPGPGVRVAGVVAGSAADRAGLREGDWLTALDGLEVPDRAAATRRVAEASPGTVLSLTVRRAGEVHVVSVPVGRRGAKDRSPLLPTQAYVARDGTWTVPTRYGLARVDPRTGESRSLWRVREGGDVRGAAAFSGTVYVWTSAPPLDDGVVVAVDAQTGRERWSVPLVGEVLGSPRCVGSAVVVDVKDPDRTYFLDRSTGSVRGAHARAERELVPVLPSPVDLPPPTASCAGMVHLLRAGRSRGGASLWLCAVNPATAWPAWLREVTSDAASNRLYPPLLAGGSVVALAVTDDEIQVTVPPLDGTAPGEPLAVDALRFEKTLWGKLESGARLVVAGDFVHVLRTRDRRASVGSLEIDRLALKGAVREDPANWHPARGILWPTSSTNGEPHRSSAWPLIVASRATMEGVWADASWFDPGAGPVEGRTAWFEPTRADELVVFHTTASVLRSQGPVRVGRRMLLATDDGYLVVPLVPQDAR